MNIQKHCCLYCGKEDPRDKKNRPVLFCCKEHRKLFTETKLHYCTICGKPALFDKKYRRWKKTCGNSSCIKTAARLAQKKGVENRNKLYIPKDEIIELYIIKNKSRLELANHYNCSEATIKKYLKINRIIKGIKNRDIHTKATKQKLYGNPKYTNIKKQKQTCKKKYGVSCNLCLYKQIKPRNSSKIEIEWLKSLNIDTIILHHVINKRKYKTYIVDGFDPKTNTVYEFLGDYWHGNLDKYKPMQINKVSHKRMKTLNKQTFIRFDEIKKLGYKIIYIWESEYKQGKNPRVY